MSSDDSAVIYEQPLTERVRVFLRLEFLCAQLRHHRNDHSEFGVRGSLHVLLDILSVLSRSDLKNDILKELSERHAALTRLAAQPGVDPDLLGEVLQELRRAVAGLQRLATQFAGNLMRENDFLTTVANRYAMPGGTCGFDVPILHFWLSQPRTVAEADLDRWSEDIRPFEDAIVLYLRLLRESREAETALAPSGMYIHSPRAACQLLRVHVPKTLVAYPEISASRHRFSIRFVTLRQIDTRSQQIAVDVPFAIQSCAL